MSDEIKQTEGYKLQNLKHQYLAVIVANLVFMGHGSMIGWMSPALPVLTSENTPLTSGPLNNEQLGWIGSINGLAAIFGSFFCGLICTFMGPKRTMLTMAIPTFSFWILIYFAETYYWILIARFLNGIVAGGVQTTVILYISNIVSNEARGRFASFSQLSRNIGILLSYVLGAFLPYNVIPCIFVFLPICFGIAFSIFPNSPQYYLKRGQIKKAESSLKFYKNCKGETVDEVMAIKAEFDRLESIANELKADPKITLKDIFNRIALKGIINGIILANLSHFTGFLVFITYAALIFDTVGASRINPSITSISLAVLQLVGTLCTTKFSDSLGRKACLIYSYLGSAFGVFSCALYTYLIRNGYDLSAFEWVPIVSLSFVIFAASAGAVPLTGICTIESIPTKTRTVGLTICNCFNNAASFYCLMLFPILTASIDLHGCMSIFGTACTLAAFYVYFALEETMGKDLDSTPSNVIGISNINC